MPTIKFSQNEKKAAQVAGAVGGAVIGAVGGAVKGAIKGVNSVAQQQQHQQQHQQGAPMAVAMPMQQPGYPQQQGYPQQPGYPQQQVIIQQAAPMYSQPAPVLVTPQMAGSAITGTANFVRTAFGGTEYPPRDACLCCGSFCCYTTLTSDNWCQCSNHCVPCCAEVECCWCTSAPLQSDCCVDHLGCSAQNGYTCCNCGMCCCHFKFVSPNQTKVCLVGHSQCCFQVSAVAIPCSGRTGVPSLLTVLGLNLSPQCGMCLKMGEAMQKAGQGMAPANDMER